MGCDAVVRLEKRSCNGVFLSESLILGTFGAEIRGSVFLWVILDLFGC